MPQVEIDWKGVNLPISYEDGVLKINDEVVTPVDPDTPRTDLIEEAEYIIDEDEPEDRRRWLLALFFAPHIKIVEDPPALSAIDEVVLRLIKGQPTPDKIIIKNDEIWRPSGRHYELPTTGSDMGVCNFKKLVAKVCK